MRFYNEICYFINNVNFFKFNKRDQSFLVEGEIEKVMVKLKVIVEKYVKEIIYYQFLFFYLKL